MLFLTAGWVVFAFGVHLAAKVLASPRRRRVGLVTLVLLSLLGGFALFWRGPAPVPEAPPGTRWVSVSTGSRLAYQELMGTGRHHSTPVVFLHGGPGVAEMRADIPYLQRLADDGWDVYIYDQLGAGRSSRLSDPEGYTLARAVADLDAFRHAMGARRVDLLG